MGVKITKEKIQKALEESKQGGNSYVPTQFKNKLQNALSEAKTINIQDNLDKLNKKTAEAEPIKVSQPAVTQNRLEMLAQRQNQYVDDLFEQNVPDDETRNMQSAAMKTRLSQMRLEQQQKKLEEYQAVSKQMEQRAQDLSYAEQNLQKLYDSYMQNPNDTDYMAYMKAYEAHQKNVAQYNKDLQTVKKEESKYLTEYGKYVSMGENLQKQINEYKAAEDRYYADKPLLFRGDRSRQKSYLDWLNTALEKAEQNVYIYAQQERDASNQYGEQSEQRRQAEQLYRDAQNERDRLQSEVAEYKVFYDSQVWQDRYAEYESLTNAEDFEQYKNLGEQYIETGKAPAAADMQDKLIPVNASLSLGANSPFIKQEEMDIYKYILGKNGAVAAREYLDFMEGTLNQRSAESWATAVKNVKDPITKGAMQGATAFAGGLERFATGAMQLFTDDALNTGSAQLASQMVREDIREDGSVVGGVLYDIIENAANQLPNMAVSAASGGAGLAMMAGSAAGNAKNEALKKGHSAATATAYGTMVGASEALLGKLIGGMANMGGSLTGHVAKTTIKNIDNAFLRAAADIGVNALSEGVEEYLQEILEPMYANLVLEETNEFNFISEDAAYAFLLGALSSAGSNVVAVGGKVVSDAAVGKAIKDQMRVDEIVDRALTMNGTEAQRIAERMKNGTRKETNANVGELVRQMMNDGYTIEQYAEDIGIAPMEVKAETEAEPPQKTAAETASVQETATAKDWVNAANVPTGTELAGISDEDRAQAERISKLIGKEVVLYNKPGTKNGVEDGFYDKKTGKLYVNVNGTAPIAQTVAHELTHSTEIAETYERLSKLVLKRIRKEGGNLNELRRDKANFYAQNGATLKTPAAVDQEIVAEYVAKRLLTNEQSIAELVREDRTLGEKILSWLDRLLSLLGNKSASERAFIRRARRLYAKALNESRGYYENILEINQEEEALKSALRKGELTDEEFEEAMDVLRQERQELDEGVAKYQYSFGGENAATANLQALETAKKMKAEKVSAQTIFKETGWFVGADGKWRFEIDDSSMTYFPGGDAAFRARHPEYAEYRALQLRQLEELGTDTWTAADQARLDELAEIYRNEPKRLSENLKNGMATLDDILQHEDLFAAYPELKRASVVFKAMDDGERGSYNPGSNTITLDEAMRNAPETTLIHEVQHAIQNVEGFSGGANPFYWATRDTKTGEISNKLREERKNIVDGLTKEDKNKYTQYQEYSRELDKFVYGERTDTERWEEIDNKSDELYFELYKTDWFQRLTEIDRQLENKNELYQRAYRHTAGEIEARDAARRRNMSAEQRREIMPDTGDENTVFAKELARSYDYDLRDVVPATRTEALTMEATDSRNVKRFQMEVDAVLSGTFRSNELVLLGLPSSTIQMYLKSNRPLYIPQKSVKKAVLPKSEGGKHGLGIVVMYDLLYQLENPMAITGNTTAHEEKGDNSIVVWTDWKTVSGASVIVPIKIDAEGNVGIYNNVNTMFDAYKEEYVSDLLRDGNILYTRNNESIQSLLAQRRQVPEWQGANAFNDSIREQPITVNKQFSFSEPKKETTEAEPEPMTKEQADEVVSTLPKKAENYLERAERQLVNKLGTALHVPWHARRDFLKDIVRQISGEVLTNGTVKPETADRLFETAWKQGLIEDREFYDRYKDIKTYLRTTAVNASEQMRADIADFDIWRRNAFGTLRIVNSGGMEADVMYDELRGMAPELFPFDIQNPSDQIQRMRDVGKSIQISEMQLDQAYGKNAPKYKEMDRARFVEEINELTSELRKVKRYADDKVETETAPELKTKEEVFEAYKNLKEARKVRDRAGAKNLLTASDEMIVGRLLRGEIGLENLSEADGNIKGITEVYEASKEYDRWAKKIAKWNAARKAELRQIADYWLTDSINWKDKKAGFMYSRETMERNIHDIVKDDDKAEGIIDTYFTPVHEAVAAATKMKNEYRDRVKNLNLSRKIEEGNLVSEAHAVQLYGEATDNIQTMLASKGRIKDRDGKTLQEWQDAVVNLWKENPNLDQKKIKDAVEEFRKIYDSLFVAMNETRVRNGYEPINYRKGYFPHFQPKQAGLADLFGKVLGIEMNVTALPTTINGMTHKFRPGIQWFGNTMERLGFGTAYDAVEGFDRYIEGAADVIHTTDSIQNLRALASQIRYNGSNPGIREKVDAVRERTDLTESEQKALIDSYCEKAKFTLSNFVVELDEYTNKLANKKSRLDREMEQLLGRKFYNTAKALESRVAANMVAINPGSWMTNFAPLAQGYGELGNNLFSGMLNTMRAVKQEDGFAERSVFLTNRRGSDPLVRTWAQETSATLSKPMQWIDNFVSEALVRGRYQQNIKAGMSEALAMNEADAWVAGVMADRSKGAVPTMFLNTNPLIKLFTQFQLEVNNQYSYMFKDMPRNARTRSVATLAGMIIRLAIGTWIFNDLYEWVFGRRPVVDPLNMLVDFTGDLVGFEDPNLAEVAADLLSGEGINLSKEQETLKSAGGNLLTTAAENIPFVGGLIGGGRLPINSAIPDFAKLANAATNSNWSAKKRLETGLKEMAKPLLYLVLPFGGGQFKKVVEGVAAVAQGGSYAVNNEGEAELQYPVYNRNVAETLWNGARAAIFGKNTLQTGVDWVESDFKNLSAKETACYQGMVNVGADQEEAFVFLNEFKSIQKTDDVSKQTAQKQFLKDSDLPGSAKSIVYYSMFTKETEEGPDKKRKFMDAMADNGSDMSAITETMLGADAADKARQKRELIAGAPLTEEEKIAMYRCYFETKQEDGTYSLGADQEADLAIYQQNGLSLEDYVTAKGQKEDLADRFEKSADRELEFYKWVSEQGYSAKQAEAVRGCFYSGKNSRYVELVSAGLPEKTAYSITKAVNDLEPLPGKKQVLDLQKYEAVLSVKMTGNQQMAAMAEVMTDKQYKKLETAYQYDIAPTVYVSFLQMLPEFDENESGSYGNKEVEKALRSVGTSDAGSVQWAGGITMTKQQKAALWQILAGKATKGSSNPFDRKIGKEVWSLMHGEDDE